MKKMLVLSVVLVGFLAGFVLAAEEDKDVKTFSVSAEIGAMSRYLDAKSGRIYADGPVEQGEISISTLFCDLSVWNSASLERRTGKTDGDEIDYTISRSNPLFLSKELGSIEMEYGISYYDFAKLCHGHEGNAIAGYFEAVRALAMNLNGKASAETYLRYEVVKTTPGSDFEGGTYSTLGVRSEADVDRDFIAKQDIGLTRDDGVYGIEPDWVLSYQLSVEIKQSTSSWCFSPIFVLTVPFHGGAETVFGLSVSTEF